MYRYTSIVTKADNLSHFLFVSLNDETQLNTKKIGEGVRTGQYIKVLVGWLFWA